MGRVNIDEQLTIEIVEGLAGDRRDRRLVVDEVEVDRGGRGHARHQHHHHQEAAKAPNPPWHHDRGKTHRGGGRARKQHQNWYFGRVGANRNARALTSD